MADLAARHRRVADRVEAAVLAVLRSGRYVGGPVVAEAEARMAARSGWTLGVGVGSGTDALTLAIQALGVGSGDEVIVPAVTFFATAEAVLRAGAIPIVADVREDLPLLDAERLPLGPRTRLVVAVHLYGEACRLGELPVPVLDDAAQCAGADPPVRTGVAAAMSLYPTKNLGVAGDGGLVLTDDPAIADRVRRLGSHGMPSPNLHERVSGHVGGNSRLDALQAAILLAHLDDLDARTALRRAHAARYDAALPTWVRRLPRSAGHPVHQYAVRVPRRDALRRHLAELEVETAVYYPHPVDRQPAMPPGPSTPNAARYCAETLALPVHEGLTGEELERVVEAVSRFTP